MKRDYRKDHMLRKTWWNSLPADDPLKIAYSKSATYSRAHQENKGPEPVKKIDPSSPEGKAIAKRFNDDLT